MQSHILAYNCRISNSFPTSPKCIHQKSFTFLTRPTEKMPKTQLLYTFHIKPEDILNTTFINLHFLWFLMGDKGRYVTFETRFLYCSVGLFVQSNIIFIPWLEMPPKLFSMKQNFGPISYHRDIVLELGYLIKLNLSTWSIISVFLQRRHSQFPSILCTVTSGRQWCYLFPACWRHLL